MATQFHLQIVGQHPSKVNVQQPGYPEKTLTLESVQSMAREATDYRRQYVLLKAATLLYNYQLRTLQKEGLLIDERP